MHPVQSVSGPQMPTGDELTSGWFTNVLRDQSFNPGAMSMRGLTNDVWWDWSRWARLLVETTGIDAWVISEWPHVSWALFQDGQMENPAIVEVVSQLNALYVRYDASESVDRRLVLAYIASHCNGFLEEQAQQPENFARDGSWVMDDGTYGVRAAGTRAQQMLSGVLVEMAGYVNTMPYWSLRRGTHQYLQQLQTYGTPENRGLYRGMWERATTTHRQVCE